MFYFPNTILPNFWHLLLLDKLLFILKLQLLMHLQFPTISQRYKLYSDPSKMKIPESKKKIWGEVKFLSMEIPTRN